MGLVLALLQPVLFTSSLLSAEDGQELVSPCLSAGFRGEWEHAEVTYRIAGQEAGMAWRRVAWEGRWQPLTPQHLREAGSLSSLLHRLACTSL